MGHITTVAGIERHAVLRHPNGIECDTCGKQLWHPRTDGERLRRWAYVEHNWRCENGKDLCPSCWLSDYDDLPIG